MSNKPCPVEGCTKTTPANLLMCREHWLWAPRALRAEVTSQWQTIRKGATRDIRREARLAYRFARAAAIAAAGRAETETADLEAKAAAKAPA